MADSVFISVENVAAPQMALIPGQETTVSFTIKNIFGSRIVRMWLELELKNADFVGGENLRYAHLCNVVGSPSDATGVLVNINPGETRTYDASFKIPSFVADNFANTPGLHAVPIRVKCTVSFTNAWTNLGGDNFNTLGVYVLNRYYQPRITLMKFERAIDGLPNDEGENVLSNIKLSVADGANTGSMSAKLYYAANEQPSTDSDSIDLTGSISDLLSGIYGSSTLITNTFSKVTNWEFLLVFGDEYEESRARYTISRSFVNMHLSGQVTGGVCFGGFSSSEFGEPKFECYYPAYFYGGIALGGGGGGGITPASAIKTIAQSQFQNNAEVEAVDLPGATTLNTYAFQNCTSLKTVNLPLVATIPAYCFSGCSALEKVDLGAATSLAGAAFQNCSSMSTLILRASSRAAVLASTFTGSGVALKTCMIFVPSALVASYQGASVWSTYKDQIFAIEDYPEITGG